MSEPVPEYDLGKPDEFEQFQQHEPGLPDEMVEEISEEPAAAFGFNFELIAELTPVLGAVLVTVAIVELAKGLGLRWLLKRRWAYGKETRTTIYKWIVFLLAVPVSAGWGFRKVALDVVSVQLSWVEALGYGGVIVATGARLFYEWDLSQIAKDKLYKFLRVPSKHAPDGDSANGHLDDDSEIESSLDWTADTERDDG